MLKLLLFHALSAALVIQCGANRRPGDALGQNRQAVEQGDEKRKCDFSSFKPMKARANHGSPIISMPQPAYASELKSAGVRGKVVALLLVNVMSGLVEQVCVTEGDERLVEPVKDAGMLVNFQPYSKYILDRYSHAEEIVIYNFVAQ